MDWLFERDGRTLGELESGLEMSRFGVMKHLRVLEEAGLVLTRRRGCEKLHFLNPVPIRLVHDRWVSKYAAPWASALSELKRDLEDETMEKVFEIYIKCRASARSGARTSWRRARLADVGDRARRRLLPPHRHARWVARGREPSSSTAAGR